MRNILAILISALSIATIATAAPEPFSSEKVEQAIQKGIDYLFSTQKPDGSWALGKDEGSHHDNVVGVPALAVYALMEAGIPPTDPRIAKALEWLTKQNPTQTYSIASRASAYGAAVRHGATQYRQFLKRDVAVLLKVQENGAYRYINGTKATKGSTSNDHMGALGIWAGKLAGLEIPAGYWQMVYRYWASIQNRDGGWFYAQGAAKDRKKPMEAVADGKSSASMTCAGIVTLYVCLDNLQASKYLGCGQQIESDKHVEAGLKWMDKNLGTWLTSKRAGNSMYSYMLYAVERATLASGYKYFGKTDWYKVGATELLKYKKPDGSFLTHWPKKDTVIDTAFAIIFLSRGQSPVLFNKLEFNGDWNNRPRDLASLTRWISQVFENTYNWQIINLEGPASDLHDAAMLYLSGAKEPKFTDAELEKLRNYVLQGGTIFSAAECRGIPFQKGIRDIYKKLFPAYELTVLPADHPLYTFHFKVPGKVKLYTISNGIRPLVVHTDEDLPRFWQGQQTSTGQWAYELAGNLVLYLSDKGAGLRKRGEPLWPDAKTFNPVKTVNIARVEYAGQWNPEPMALNRLALLMGNETMTKLNLQTVKATDLQADKTSVAFLTGTGEWTPDPATTTALKQYVQNGGTLVIDAAGGNSPFAKSAEAALRSMFGVSELKDLPPDSTIYTLKGHEVSKIAYRRVTRKRIRNEQPLLMAVMQNNRPAVIFSREDLTAGLLGYPSTTIDGYMPQTAYALVRNIILDAINKK